MQKIELIQPNGSLILVYKQAVGRVVLLYYEICLLLRINQRYYKVITYHLLIVLKHVQSLNYSFGLLALNGTNPLVLMGNNTSRWYPIWSEAGIRFSKKSLCRL